MSDQERTVETPGPGVYPDIPPDTYHAWAAASNSQLSRLLQSPAHLKAYREGEQKDTPARKLGRAIHTAVLEPDLFPDRYVVPGQCEATKRDGHRCGNDGLFLHAHIGWVCGVHARGKDDEMEAVERETLGTEEWKTCVGVRDQAHSHSLARALLTGEGSAELSVLWEDRATGVLCKSRWDRHTPDIEGGSIVDLKSAGDGSLLAFEKSLFRFGYHRQAAFYLRGAKARRLPARHFSIIAFEKDPPYAVAVYRISDAVVDGVEDHRGPQDVEGQLTALLRLYALCEATGEWPGYVDRVRDISIPAYGWAQIDEQTEEVREQIRRIERHTTEVAA